MQLSMCQRTYIYNQIKHCKREERHWEKKIVCAGLLCFAACPYIYSLLVIAGTPKKK